MSEKVEFDIRKGLFANIPSCHCIRSVVVIIRENNVTTNGAAYHEIEVSNKSVD